MPRFIVEKLPQHWLFVPSKRQLRDMLTRLGANVPLVEFYGTGYGCKADWLSLGFVESRVVEGGWRFYLRHWGVREDAVDPWREGLAEAALAEIECYVSACLSQPPAEVTKPSQLSLTFRLDLDGVRSACRVKVVGRYSYPTPGWWQSKRRG
jgi:hypothetical protein